MRRVALVIGLGLFAAGAPASAQAGDWTVRRDPFDRALIGRYKALLARQPHDGLALSALVSLYKRHRTIGLLVSEYETEVVTRETASGAIVLGRLARNANEHERALELFVRATRLADADPRSWLAVGELRNRTGDKPGARVAFARAVETATRDADRRAALRELVAATIADRDTEATMRAFNQLLSLAPRDGQLWAERGDAELELGQFEAAASSYQRAEELLARDPERKLIAITSRARALDLGNLDRQAVREYERAIDASPPGYYLCKELIPRIVDVIRRHRSALAARDYLEDRWPRATRGAYEWTMLADLSREIGNANDRRIALEHAVAAAPKDAGLQWQLIQWHDKDDNPDAALEVLEAAARAVPRDVSIQLELAQRLWVDADGEPRDQARALELARRLSTALPRSVDAQRTLSEVYSRWDKPELALAAARIVAELEPDTDNLAMLGDSLYDAGRFTEARDAWLALAAAGTPEVMRRVGDIYLDHELWESAVELFTKAIATDAGNPQLWRGRAAAFEALGNVSDALRDARHALALLGVVPYDKGHDVRFRLVHIVTGVAQRAANDPDAEPEPELAEWTRQLTSADDDTARQAGYLLAEYYARRLDPRLSPTLFKLHRIAPTDISIVSELIRGYRAAGEPAKALPLARELAKIDPALATLSADLVTAIEAELPATTFHAMPDDKIRDRDIPEPFDRCCRTHDPHSVPAMVGLRVGLGDGMRGPASGTWTLGARFLRPVHSQLALSARADWVRRVQLTDATGAQRSVDAAAIGIGVAVPLMRHARGALLLGTSWRTELRLDDAMTRGPYDRLGLFADATLEVVPRHLPASLGVRLEQSLSEKGASTVFLVEATYELHLD